MYTKEEKLEIQKAIHFLVNNFENSGHNHGKPVVLHCINIAMYLFHQEYPAKIVIATLLHDLIEDTSITKTDIKNAFGVEIAGIVDAVSFKTDIEDYVEKYKDTFKRVAEYGKEAVIVKAVDIMDNAKYYYLVGSPLYEKLLQKYADFLKIAKPFIDKTRLFEDLKNSINTKQRPQSIF